MQTTWRVEKVIQEHDRTAVWLRRVEWFKKNPAFVAAMADENEEDLPEEFIDALPGEEGAELAEVGEPTLVLNVTDGPELHPHDNVILTLQVRPRYC